MVKINFIVLFFIFLSPIVCAQRVVVSDSVVFSGVVFDTQDSQTLPNAVSYTHLTLPTILQV